MDFQEIEELKKRWAREQVELQQKAIFEDHNLCFHTSPPRGSIEPDKAAPDYDDPTVHNEDPKTFTVSGLRYVGGLDISFIAQEDESAETMDFPGHNASNPNVPDAYAVITVLEYPSLSVGAMLPTNLVHSITEPIRLTAPYIPSFLSYRETPAYLELISKLRENLQKAGKEHEFPQVILVDGNGQLHEREAGVATAVGVQAGVPTVGVAKTYHPPTLQHHEVHESHWRLSQKGIKQKSREVLKRPGDYLGVLNARRDRYVGVVSASHFFSSSQFGD
ncbi:unnamed protein product [Rhizoctonia solani]|uniref:Endonuclease V n=1 Tax=Rhizoctonia solani TaxID=456999 RepID=A0A8H2WVE6_9AGAM|nr:unnamed protein product [Rhizoctonia solani]